jgi:hypothetical protein
LHQGIQFFTNIERFAIFLTFSVYVHSMGFGNASCLAWRSGKLGR